MKTTKVLTVKQLPTRGWFWLNWMTLLTVRSFDFPGWALGVIWTICGCMTLGVIMAACTEQQVKASELD
jgi:hypothetical protein